MSEVTRCDGCLEDIDRRKTVPLRVLIYTSFGDKEYHFHRTACLGKWVEERYAREQHAKRTEVAETGGFRVQL